MRSGAASHPLLTHQARGATASANEEHPVAVVERILDWLATRNEPQAGPESYPFRLRDDFLSRAELSFCQVLTSEVGDRAMVCPKVGLADLFFVHPG